MKNKIIAFCLLIIMVACQGQKSRTGNNALLGEKANIWYVPGIDNPTTPSEWLQGLDLPKLMETAFTPVLKGKIDVYSPDHEYFVNEKVPVDEIKGHLDWTDGKINYDELKELFFHETWYVAPNLKSFNKEVEFWCPVRVWNPNKNSAETYKRKCFYVKPLSKEKGIMVGKSVFTEFDFSNPSSYPYWYGFDPQRYIDSVIDNIQAGKLQAIDPVYLVDKTLIPLKVEALEKQIGQNLASEDLRKNISSFIFEENWYLNPESLYFYKEVKSIGFVKKYWDLKTGKQNSKILFFLKLE